MINRKACFEIFGFVGTRWQSVAVYIPGQQEFGLISREEIGLRVGADELHATGGAVEVVVAVLDGAIALGAGGFDFSAPAPVVGIGEGASHCVVQALEV